MFKELQPLLDGRTVIITAAKTSEGQLTVTVYPSRNGEKDEPPVAMTPLCVSGTAEELDHELPGLLLGYVEAIGGFRSNLAAIKAQVAEASAAAAAARAAKTTKKTAAAPKPAATAKATEPAVIKPDLFAVGMPPAEAPVTALAAEINADPDSPVHNLTDTVLASDVVHPSGDPRVLAPPTPPLPAAAPAAAPRKPRATPIRGKAVETAPVPSIPAAPAAPRATEVIGLASEQEESDPVPVVAAAPVVSAAPATDDLGWADDDTAPAEVAAGGAPIDEDDDCPF